MALDLVNNYSHYTATGQMDVSEATTIIQEYAVYTLSENLTTLASGTGSTSGINTQSEFQVTSGTATGAFSFLYSKRAVPFVAGQSMGMSIDARFDTPQVNNRCLVGFSNSSDSLAFGYDGTTFGINYSHHGQQKIIDLFVTARATAATNATITLSGLILTVPLPIGVTISDTARDIALGINAATSIWRAQAIGTKVVIRSILSQPYTGTFAFSHATAAANYVLVVEGVTPTREFTAVADWSSPFDENKRHVNQWFTPSKGNVYKIFFNYGYGNVIFQIFQPSLGKFTTVHELQYANTGTRPFVNNPNFRVTYSTINIGTTAAPCSVYGSCMYGYIDGHVEFLEPSHHATNTNLAVSTTDASVLTIANRETFGGKVNVQTALLNNISVASTSTKNTIITIVKNPTYVGNQIYQFVNENTAYTLYSTVAVTITLGTGTVVDSFTLTGTNSVNRDMSKYGITFVPGDSLVVLARVSSGAASEVTVALAFDEQM